MSLLLFLGGTANQSSWRDDLIPLLEHEDIAYFNPVVPNWDDEAFERELFIKSLPNTVEMYVITKEMRGPYSVAEAVEASNKKPDKTIFLVISDGMDSHQIKSLEAVQKIIYENGAYIANNLFETVFIFKGICLGMQQERLNSRLASRRDFLELNKIISYFEKNSKSNTELSYEEIFRFSGISNFLESIYLDASDLSKTYRDVFFNSLKKFLKNPLFKNMDFNDQDDLRFLRDSLDFKEYTQNVIDDIKDKLVSRKARVEKYIESLEAKEVSIADLTLDTKIDKVSLMFILHEMKENKKIYDFNGRSVTLN